ncbi:hypothetical protein L1F34_000229 [Mammaliicoccus lentus]
MIYLLNVTFSIYYYYNTFINLYRVSYELFVNIFTLNVEYENGGCREVAVLFCNLINNNILLLSSNNIPLIYSLKLNSFYINKMLSTF